MRVICIARASKFIRAGASSPSRQTSAESAPPQMKTPRTPMASSTRGRSLTLEVVLCVTAAALGCAVGARELGKIAALEMILAQYSSVK